MARFLIVLLSVALLLVGADAQFQYVDSLVLVFIPFSSSEVLINPRFFEQMFNQGGQQQQRQQPQNVPSDSNWYQENYNNGNILLSLLHGYCKPLIKVTVRRNANNLISLAHCDKYLCPDTRACVHFPHHCPCAHPLYEEKFELGEGKAICVSKSGFKAGEAARKVELARKGLL